MTVTETNEIQDIVKFELDDRYCREVCEVYAGQSLNIGDICEPYSTSDDAKVQLTAAVNEVQTLTFSGTPTGGTFVIWIESLDHIMVPTAPIAYNASAATITTALNLACGVTNGIVATGSTLPNQVITLTYSGAGYAGLPWKRAVVDVSASTGGTPACVEAVSVKGHASGALADSICLEAATPVNEVQQLVFAGTPTGGTFTLTFVKYDGTRVTTAGIAYNASASTITTAIDTALGETGTCVVTGSTLPDQTLTATFSGPNYAGRPQHMIEANLASLTGGAPTCVISRTTTGAQGKALFLTRGAAIVDKAYLDFNGRTEANAIAALAALGILVRTGPTYTTL